MMNNAKTRTTGGKGNAGMFIERDPTICAAGISNLDRNTVANILPSYSLQDHVDALISDTINDQSIKLPEIRLTPMKRDMRNAGYFSEGSDLINPPVKTKFQTLVSDLKNTIYSSYWKKEVGRVPDPTGNLPKGLNVYHTTMGKKYPDSMNAYDTAFPKIPVIGQTPSTKECGYRRTYNYCSFNPNRTFGMRTNADSSSKQIKYLLTDDRVILGTNLRQPICSNHAAFIEGSRSKLGIGLAPNNNIYRVPKGFAFGKFESVDDFGVAECLNDCEINPDRTLYLKCLGHLNTLRKFLSKRLDAAFYHKLVLHLKYLDKSGNGWLPKNTVYKICQSKYIRFESGLIEPLLMMWNIFDGYQIMYKPFVRILNYREPTPDLPKISSIPDDCCNYKTTYNEMTKDVCITEATPMAGIPSGRYIDKDFPITPDGCCKAHRSYLPEESDAKSCLNPSIFTVMGISHRDMFAKRDASIVRLVFEKAGEKFSDEQFECIWKIAEKYHSLRWVSFETFRRAIREFNTHQQHLNIV